MSTVSVRVMPVEEDVYFFPASFFQESLWFLDQLEHESAVYNKSVALQLDGSLDVGVLEQVLNVIVQRHEALRTTFMTVEGQVMQVIRPTQRIPLQAVDLRSIPKAEQEGEALRLATEDVQLPFDLTHGPLMRTTLLQLGVEEYVLLVTTHHIISDEWSMIVLCQELAAHYEAFSHGQSSPLPQLPIQYADYAVWQRQWLQGEALETQLSYWRQQLDEVPAVLELPADYQRPAVQTFRGAPHSFALSKEVADALKALSHRAGVSLFMTLLAAFDVLLHRYTGQTDIVIGSPIANRNRSGVEELIGYFVNTLVLRTDLAGNPTFEQVLRRVREVALEAYDHQDLPFEKLVEELHPERNLSHNPLFQVMFSFQSDPTPTFDLPGLRLRLVEIANRTAKFDLTLTVGDTGQGLTGLFEYSTDLFEPATISRMVGHFQTLLEGIVAAPEQRISELPLLRAAERHQLLVEWNETRSDYPQDQCIHRLFEAQVERTPSATAVVFKHKRVTYQELNRKANQLAHYLQLLGVRPETPVGLCVERSLDMVVGLLGILKAGGVYVPLDPDYPRERLGFLLADTQMPVLLTHQHLVSRLPEHHPRLVHLDTNWQTIGQQSEMNLVGEVRAKQLAYVIYTSGSTGQPKGVLIEHQAIVAHCWAIMQVYELGAEDCVLQFSTTTFDASLEQILPTLLVGAQLVLREQEVWSPADLLRTVKDLGLTVINLPPAYWHHVLQEWVQTPTRLLGHRLRLVIVGGDRLPPEALQLWWQMPLRSVRLLNAYGPTETTITATIFDITRHMAQEQASENVPIGHPLPNRRIYLLNKASNPVPVGVAGELHIGGDLLARGYLNRPELTAASFLPDLFRQQPRARLYKTGDLARYLPDGTIEFLGRIDQQVKIRGFRIELGEIEAVLSQHPAVLQAVVAAREDRPGESYVVAYVVARGQAAESGILRSYLKQKLPEYMIPAAFVQLESLPLMSNGKVNRRALPMPEGDRRGTEETFVAPSHLMHRQLVQIWEDLLHVRPIGIRDNFFLLGGHSLLAARLINRIERIFGNRIPLTTLFAGPTIEELTSVLLRRGGENSWPRAPLIPVQIGGPKRPFFFLHGDYTGGAFYCFPLAQGLGPDQPLYALEPYSFDGLQVPPTLEAMAAAHITSLRAVQPEGPYLLGGFCNGGLVAYEMARQLHTQGETVDLLVLINPTPTEFRRFVRTVMHGFGTLVGLNQEKQLDLFLWLRHTYRYLQHAYRYVRFPSYRRLQTELDPTRVGQNGGAILTLKAQHELWLSYGSEPSKTDEQVDKGPGRHSLHVALPMIAALFPEALFPTIEALRHDWEGLFTWIASDYTPGFYAGKSTFFFSWDWHSEEPLPSSVKWRKVAKAKDQEVEIHSIAGTHDTCKTEHLHDMAEHLRTCLNAVQEAESRQSNAVLQSEQSPHLP